MHSHWSRFHDSPRLPQSEGPLNHSDATGRWILRLVMARNQPMHVLMQLMHLFVQIHVQAKGLLNNLVGSLRQPSIPLHVPGQIYQRSDATVKCSNSSTVRCNGQMHHSPCRFLLLVDDFPVERLPQNRLTFVLWIEHVLHCTVHKLRVLDRTTVPPVVSLTTKSITVSS